MEDINNQGGCFEVIADVESEGNSSTVEDEDETLLYSLVHHSEETYEDQTILSNLNSNPRQDCNDSPFTVSRRNKVFRLDAVKEITGVLDRNRVPSHINDINRSFGIRERKIKIMNYGNKKPKQRTTGEKLRLNKSNETVYRNALDHSSQYQFPQNQVAVIQCNNMKQNKSNTNVSSNEKSNKSNPYTNSEAVEAGLGALFNDNLHQYESNSLFAQQESVKNVLNLKFTVGNKQKVDQKKQQVDILWRSNGIDKNGENKSSTTESNLIQAISVAECVREYEERVKDPMKNVDVANTSTDMVLNEYIGELVRQEKGTEPLKSVSNTNNEAKVSESKSADKRIESLKKVNPEEFVSKYGVELNVKKIHKQRDKQQNKGINGETNNIYLNTEGSISQIEAGGLPLNSKVVSNFEATVDGMVQGPEIICLDSSSSDSELSVVEVYVPPPPPPPMVSLDSSDESSIGFDCTHPGKSNSEMISSCADTVILIADEQNKKRKRRKKSDGRDDHVKSNISPTQGLIFLNHVINSLEKNDKRLDHVEMPSINTPISDFSYKPDNMIAQCSSSKSLANKKAKGIAVNVNSLGCISDKEKKRKKKKKETGNLKRKKKRRLEGFENPVRAESSSSSAYHPSSWTSDMVQFYDNSWGDENYDHVMLQKNMSGNPNKWRILEEDRIGPLRMTGPSARIRCNNCNQLGHSSWQCPDRPKVPICHMCGQKGHREPRCPNKICLKCGRPSYLYVHGCEKCNVPAVPYNCLSCGQHGHYMWQCPDSWIAYHSVTTAADMATTKEVHYEITYKPHQLQFCCNCARQGHHVDSCHFLPPPVAIQSGRRPNCRHPPNKRSRRGRKDTQTVTNGIPKSPRKVKKAKLIPNNMSQQDTVLGTKVKPRGKKPKRNSLRTYITKKKLT